MLARNPRHPRINFTVMFHLLKVSDMLANSVLCFENCRTASCPVTFELMQFAPTEPEFRNIDHIDVQWARTEMGISLYDNEEAKLLNDNVAIVDCFLYHEPFKANIKHFNHKRVW